MPIKYIGSKRRIIPHILNILERFHPIAHVLDPFSGSCRVGTALRSQGYRVTGNDITQYGFRIGAAYLESTYDDIQTAVKTINTLKSLTPKAGWFTEHYCVKARFFQPHNGEKIDPIREWIRDNIEPNTIQHNILITALIEAACRVDSSVGQHNSYLKGWSPRSYNQLDLKVPDTIPFNKPVGKSFNLDAIDMVKYLDPENVDAVYLDPPYNQHNYRSYYHVWETLAIGDTPETYGVTEKRLDNKTVKSKWNRKTTIQYEFIKLINALKRYPLVLTSFSDEGFLNPDWLFEQLAYIGTTHRIGIQHPRNIMGKIAVKEFQTMKETDVQKGSNIESLYITIPGGSEHRFRHLESLRSFTS